MNDFFIPDEIITLIVSFCDGPSSYSFSLVNKKACNIVRKVKQVNNEKTIKRLTSYIVTEVDYIFDGIKPNKNRIVSLIEWKYLLSRNDFDPSFDKNLAIMKASYGYDELIKLLIADKRIDIVQLLLHTIPSYCKPETLKLVLNDARILKKSYFKLNEMLISATIGGRVDNVRLLLNDERISPNDFDTIALCEAAYRGHFEILMLLINNSRFKITEKVYESLNCAAKGGHLNIIKYLLTKFRFIQKKYDEAMVNAVFYGHAKVVEYFLTKTNANPHYNNNKIINIAVKNRNIKIVKILLKDGRVASNNALVLAAQFGCLRIVKLLLKDKRIDIDDIDRALIMAKYYEHTKVSKLLIKNRRIYRNNSLCFKL